MAKRRVRIGDVECGGDRLFLISGPCVIEEESVMLETAEALARVSERLGVPVIYKSSFKKDNRSSLDTYAGPGLGGLPILARVREEFGFPILSDIHTPAQAAPAAETLDVLQIPAYLCMQSELIAAAADTGRAVNLKHGQFLAPENMAKPVQKVLDRGNERILVTERGYTFGYNDLVVDPRAFHHLRSTEFPVVFDITHSIRRYGIPSTDPRGGAREYLPTIARAGVAAGVDGVFIETHPDPGRALCDAASQMCVFDLEAFLEPLLEIHDVEVSYRT